MFEYSMICEPKPKVDEAATVSGGLSPKQLFVDAAPKGEEWIRDTERVIWDIKYAA